VVVNLPSGRVVIRDSRFAADEPVALESGVYDTYVFREQTPPDADVTFLISPAKGDDQTLLTALALFLALSAMAGTIFAIWQLDRRKN
jgi:hypothetical protein